MFPFQGISISHIFFNQLYIINKWYILSLNNWWTWTLIDWLFTVLRPAQEFFTDMETSPLPVKGLQNLDLCSALKAFEQGGIYMVPHVCCAHRTSVFPVSSEGPPLCVALTTHKGDVEDLFSVTRILTGPHSVAFYDTQGDVEDLF
jgi:hypothetical protein